MSYFTPFLHRLLLRGNEVQTHCVISHGNERGFKWQANNWKAWDKGTRCSGPGSTCSRTNTQAVGNQKTKNGIQIQSLYLSKFTCVHLGQSKWNIYSLNLRISVFSSKIPSQNPLFSRQICTFKVKFALFSKTFQSRWWSSHCFASHSGCRDLSLNTVSIFMGE